MEIKIPFLGDGIDSATVLAVLVSVGDTVAVDDTLIELETDKATAPVPATAAGTVESIHVAEGDAVSQGRLVVSLSGASGASAEPVSADVSPAAAPAQAVPAVAAPVTAPVAAPPMPSGAPVAASPSLRKIAKEIGLELSRIAGTGNGGRITTEDVKQYMAWLQSAAAASATGSVSSDQPSLAPSHKPLPDFSKWGEIKTEKLSSLRQTIGGHMSECWSRIPHVTQFDSADITELMAIRKKAVPGFKKKNARLTVTVFVLKALVAALKEFPIFNASYDEAAGELIHKSYYHIGVAVDTDNGLIVPVIKNVDEKSMLDLSLELDEIAVKARQRKIGLEELQGGTFTVSNLGGLGVGPFTPIVNHPEVGILGLGKGAMVPRLIDGKLNERLEMPLALSYDHRVIDGADGARFIRRFISELEAFDASLLKEK